MRAHTYIHTHTHHINVQVTGEKVLIVERRIREENFHSLSEQHGNKAALYHSVSEYVVTGLNLVHLSTEGDTLKKTCFKLIDVQN